MVIDKDYSVPSEIQNSKSYNDDDSELFSHDTSDEISIHEDGYKEDNVRTKNKPNIQEKEKQTENKESDGPYEKFHRFLRKELPKRYTYITVDHVMDYFKDKNDCEEYDETNRDHREGFTDYCKFDEVIKYAELYRNYFFLNFKTEEWFDLWKLSMKVEKFSSSSSQKQTENKKSDEPYKKFHRFLRKELPIKYPHIHDVDYVMDFFKNED